MNRTTRGALQAAAAGLLLAALAFLFVKTAGIDFKNDAQALSLLREMKDLDSHWDDEVRRQADDFAATAAPRSDFASMMGRILAELDRAPAGDAFRKDVAQLRAGLDQKNAAARAAGAAHASSREAAQALHASLAELVQLGGPAAAGAKQLDTDIHRRLETFPARVAMIQEHLSSLAAAARGNAAASAGAERVRAASTAFLAARAGELEAFNRFSFLTLGGRIELSTRTLSAAIERMLDEKERWRTYLFAYALALLIASAYLAVRVASAQSELRRANEELERRVGERTRDLSSTLKRLQESEAQLVQSEKMSSLGQMVAGVAH